MLARLQQVSHANQPLSALLARVQSAEAEVCDCMTFICSAESTSLIIYLPHVHMIVHCLHATLRLHGVAV